MILKYLSCITMMDRTANFTTTKVQQLIDSYKFSWIAGWCKIARISTFWDTEEEEEEEEEERKQKPVLTNISPYGGNIEKRLKGYYRWISFCLASKKKNLQINTNGLEIRTQRWYHEWLYTLWYFVVDIFLTFFMTVLLNKCGYYLTEFCNLFLAKRTNYFYLL